MEPRYYNERTVLVSVSGGRTSGYMARWMADHPALVAEHIGAETVDLRFVFANTGMEHPDTLRFMADISRHWGLEVVWVEAEVRHGERKSSGHTIVSPEEAHTIDDWRKESHPFHSFIRKYGVPNTKFLGCTREMKRNTIASYMRSIGFGGMKDYHTAIGIRADEKRRVSARAGVENIFYPLVDLEPVDKEDILEWWADKPWDLKISEWLGNCVMCYKKSWKKLRAVWTDFPEAFDFTRDMEARYGNVGPEFTKYDDAKPRSFFRGNLRTDDLIGTFIDSPDPKALINVMRDAGCSESCELYETENPEGFSV